MNLTPSQAFRKEVMNIIQEVMDDCDVWKTCLNCKYFTEQTELCNKSIPPTRPPARIITFGCGAFVDVDANIAVRPTTIPPNLPKPKVNVFDDDIPF